MRIFRRRRGGRQAPLAATPRAPSALEVKLAERLAAMPLARQRQLVKAGMAALAAFAALRVAIFIYRMLK
jgi:hypothetical protein